MITQSQSVFLILNFVFPVTLYITQSLVQLNLRQILQIIKNASNDCQKLLGYFSEAAIFLPFDTALLPTAVGFPKVLDLYLNDIELFAVALSGQTALTTEHSSPLKCQNLSQTSRCVRITINILKHIVYRHCNINDFSSINMFFVYDSNTFCKW